MLRSRARLVTASLLLASAAAFATGVAIEHTTSSSESHRVEQHADVDTRTTPAAGTVTATTPAAESQSENLLGINPEATGLVVIAVALSLLLAALVLTVRSPAVAAGIAVTMLAFTVLDIREVTHQLNESRSGLAAFAAVVALLHLLAAASALPAARAARDRAGGAAT